MNKIERGDVIQIVLFGFLMIASISINLIIISDITIKIHLLIKDTYFAWLVTTQFMVSTSVYGIIHTVIQIRNRTNIPVKT